MGFTKRLIFVVIAGSVLIGAYFALEARRTRQVTAYLDATGPLLDDWQAAWHAAETTHRNELTPVLEEMAEVRYAFAQVVAPRPAVAFKAEMLEAMGAAIEMASGVALQEDRETMQARTHAVSETSAAALRELHVLHARYGPAPVP